MVIARLHTFVAGEVPTAAEWNADIDQILALFVAGMDSSYLTLSGATGMCDLSSAQTLSGRKTFTGGVVLNELLSVAASGAGHVKIADVRWDPASGTLANDDGWYLAFTADDDAGTPVETEYARLAVNIDDKTAASNDASIRLSVIEADTLTEAARVSVHGLIIPNVHGIIVGHTSQITTSSLAELQVLGTAAVDSTALVGRWSSDASGPVLSLAKSRNAAIGSSTIVQDNDILGTLEFMADDGTDFATPGATIFARVNGTPGANDMPTELVFATTADSGNSVTERASFLATANFAPISNDGLALGISGTAWSDLFLASGAVINFAAGDVTVTHNTNTLAFAGASSGYTFDSVAMFGTNATVDGNAATVVHILAADNGICIAAKVNALQADITTADTYLDMRSTSGGANGQSEGWIAGTGVAGVLAYNTFTGAHFTQLVDEDEEIEVGMVVVSTGTFLSGETEYLPTVTKSTQRAQKSVYGVYSGKVADATPINVQNAYDQGKQITLPEGTARYSCSIGKGANDKSTHQVFALGTGVVLVTNTGGDIEIGDLIQSSPTAGYGEKQSDDIIRSSTVAQSTEAVIWANEPETTKLIACTYTK